MPNGWTKYEDAAKQGPMALFWKCLVPVILIVIVLGAVGWVLRLASQPARIVEKTLDADNVLYNYEWFKQQYQDVQATDQKIGNTESLLAGSVADGRSRSEWGFEETQQHANLQRTLLGLENYRQDLVAKYNARSQMANRSIFKTGELPETLQ